MTGEIADLLFINGYVIMMDGSLPRVGSLVIKDGKVVHVYDHGEAL